MRLFGELTKIEDQPDGTLKVYGVASTGVRDDAGEIVRPEAMRAALPDYARYPALREMHQPTAAGRTLEAYVEEDGVTRIVAHVVDPVAVAKVKSRTYAGFSIGGKVLSRDKSDPTVITKIRLSEISLVDRPANPEAVIDLWKAREAAPLDNAAVKARAAALAKRAGRPGAWKDYVARARAAMLAEQSPNLADDEDDQAPDPADDPAPADAEPGGSSDADDEPGVDAADNDGMDADDGADDGDSGADEDDGDGDDGAVDDPALIAQRLAALAGSDIEALQAIHDAMAALGAACDPDNCPDTDKSTAVGDLAKRARLVDAMLAKAATRLDGLETRLAEQDALLQRIAATPTAPRAAAGPHARAIGKADDADPAAEAADVSAADAQKAFAALTADERAFLLMKASLRQPIPLR